MVLRGFRFGMILQLAVGPMCLLVFNTSAEHGFLAAFMVVLAISLVDGVYILLSGLGVAALIQRPGIKTAIKAIGSIVLGLFGLQLLSTASGNAVLATIALFDHATPQKLFVQGLLLTASNPLTIVFWGGVFSAQVAAHHYDKIQLMRFGLGCVMSTLVFLSAVAISGHVLSAFLSEPLIRVLNGAVGAILIFFAIRLARSK